MRGDRARRRGASNPESPEDFITGTQPLSLKNRPELLVIGGGIGGVALALALARRGLRSRVLEKAPEFGEIGYGIQQGPNAYRMLDWLGVMKDLEPQAVFTKNLILIDALTDRELTRISCGPAFRERYRAPYTVVHRRDAFRAEKILQDRLFKNPKIEVIWDSVLENVLGSEDPLKVNHVKLKNVKTGAVTERAIDGVFIAIGHSPASELFVGQVQMKPPGYIVTAGHSTATSVPGVFAAGDVTDDIYRQAVTAAGQGCMAALEAEKFLAAHEYARAAAE